MGACCAKPQTESPADFPERQHKGSTSMQTQTTPGLSKSRPNEQEGRLPRGGDERIPFSLGMDEAPAPCTPLETTEIGVSLHILAPEPTPADFTDDPSTTGLPVDHSKRTGGEPTEPRNGKAARLDTAEAPTDAMELASPQQERALSWDEGGGAVTESDDDEATERDGLVAEVVRSAVKKAVDMEMAESVAAADSAMVKSRLLVDVNSTTNAPEHAALSPSFNGLSPASKEAALEAADFFRGMTPDTATASLPPTPSPTDADKPKRIAGTWYALAQEEGKDSLESQLGVKPIVLYTTSMRAVRKTFDQCNTLRSIFQNLGCELDERDISMSAAFRAELKERLKGTAAPVPRVFIGTNYLGGFDEVQQMNESEDLRVILKKGGYLGKKQATHKCKACGNHKFVLCGLCNGRHKLYDDDGDQFDCPDCNENGLVQCAACAVDDSAISK